MTSVLSARDHLQIGEAASVLGVSEKTLRNWDRAGKLKAYRHPVNDYRLYRTSDVHRLLRELRGERPERPEPRPQVSERDGLPSLHWSPSVALDPKHRPQRWDAPSSTVRRDWRKFPQEAYVLSEDGSRYRRFTPEEVAVLQGFSPEVIDLEDLTTRQKIAAMGDAVPPPLARAVVGAVADRVDLKTSVEVCAGAGGLAEGAATAGLDHLALIDYSAECGTVLRNRRTWSPDRVHVGDARLFDYSPFAGRVGVVAGGPPCQPWSQGGQGKGHHDDRDLLSWVPELVAQVEPEAFVFENVPGLTSEQHEGYLRRVVELLQRPGGDLRYGVLVAKLNAADFGVPQVRRRVFIIGLRDRPAAEVWRCLDDIDSSKTHADPRATKTGDLPPWITVGEALTPLAADQGWRRWEVA